MPEAQPLALLRRDIDRRPERIRKVLLDPAMRKHLLGGVRNDEKQAITAFTKQNQENALKSKPKVRDVNFTFSLECSRSATSRRKF